MAIAEMSGQVGNLILLGIGIIIVLLIHLIMRVSALGKMIGDSAKMIDDAEASKPANIPVKDSLSLEVDSAIVPNTVVAAIGAALNQYRIENSDREELCQKLS